ncbi:MAG: paraslipin [Pseudomonadales bacterium]|nr:paraslipin [Pseudomonadales bacterium]
MSSLLSVAAGVLVILVLYKVHVIVPQQSRYVVERLGKYHGTLEEGFHLLLPFIDKVAHKHTLMEESIPIGEQPCVTQDNGIVSVDGILFVQVLDPYKASYGSVNPRESVIDLAQTTTRNQIGQMMLDETFKNRNEVNTAVVDQLDQAAEPWGHKVTRYEIKNIIPPDETIRDMEKLVAADREKQATILRSEGERQRVINEAEAAKADVVLASEAELDKQVNEAKGEATAIKEVAEATAKAIELVGEAITKNGGSEAVGLRVAEQYVTEFGKLAKESNTLVIPSNLSDISGMIAAATTVFEKSGAHTT